jgi:hypothetical protein
MSDHQVPEEHGRDGGPPSGAPPNASQDSGESTVGTGSIIGLGCLALVAVLVVVAIAYRLLGGTW